MIDPRADLRIAGRHPALTEEFASFVCGCGEPDSLPVSPIGQPLQIHKLRRCHASA